MALLVSDVIFADDDGSATVLVRRSKTDPTGEGAVLWLSVRTTSALKRWLGSAAILEGALFRAVGKGGKIGGALEPGEVARVFKKLARRGGSSRRGSAAIHPASEWRRISSPTAPSCPRS